MKISCKKRDKVLGFFVVLLLQLCSVVMAAKKNVERSLPVATTISSEYGAFLQLARFTPSAEQQRAVERLFAQIQERHITIKPTLYKILALADSNQLIALCKKTALFFSHVDNSRIKNSGCLSSMLRTKKHMSDFIGQADAGIALLATCPCLSSVAGMCSKRGVPDGGQVKKLLSWPVWRANGEFSEQLFRSFSGMLASKGLPKETDVTEMLSWPCWRLHGHLVVSFFARSLPCLLAGGCLKSRV